MTNAPPMTHQTKPEGRTTNDEGGAGLPVVIGGALVGHSSFPKLAVVVAAGAMVATLPGRTHGLGLVTEPLLADLGLDRVGFAAVNFWATLIGAAFCVPAGWLLDRLGVRPVLAGTALALGAVVVGMSQLPVGVGLVALFPFVLLTRGLGQSALSVASLALIGKAAGRRPGLAMG